MITSCKASEVMSEPISKRQPQCLPIVLNIKLIGEMRCKINQKGLYFLMLFSHDHTFDFYCLGPCSFSE
jgi:hypothetical protein